MTSRICSKGYHPVARFFAFTLKRQIGITLLVTAFLFLICPGILWQQVFGIGSGGYSLDHELAVWSLVIFLISLLLGIILLCYNHTHLFSRKSADMYYSLPIKRDTMLLVRFGASVVGAVFAMTASFSGLTLINFMPYVHGIDLVQMLKLYALCLMLLLLCMSTVLIFIVNSGSIFHFIFSTLVVCVGIPLLCLVAYGWYDNAAEGVATNEMWLRYVSPFFYAIACLVDQEEIRQGKVVIDTATLFISVGGTLLFAAISFLMNHRRKTEKAGDSFVYIAMPVLIAVIASALGGYLVGIIFRLDWGAHDPSFWFFFTLGAAFVAVAVGAIVSKGFRKLWRWFICAAAATVLMLSVFLVSDQMGDKAFRKIPKVDEIQAVTLQGTYCSPAVRLTEDLELVTKLHTHLIAIESGETEPREVTETVTTEVDSKAFAYRTYITTSLLNADFSFTYELKNGKTVSRTYWIRDYEGLCMLLDIVQTEEYAAAWENDLNMAGLDKLELHYYNQTTEESDVTLVTPEQAKELLRIYGQELQEAEDAVLLYEGEYVAFEMAGNNGHLYLSVHPDFTRTLALLEELLK